MSLTQVLAVNLAPRIPKVSRLNPLHKSHPQETNKLLCSLRNGVKGGKKFKSNPQMSFASHITSLPT